MLRPPQRRLDEVVRPRDGRRQHQKQDFREWIQHLGMLTRIAKGGKVIQQGDAGRGSHREASIDEAPYESDFQPRRKLPLHSSDCPGLLCYYSDRRNPDPALRAFIECLLDRDNGTSKQQLSGIIAT